jgi:EF hand
MEINSQEEMLMKTRWMGSLLAVALISVAAAQPRLDADGDGRVSAQEFESAQAEIAAARFARLDADSDGYLTREELEARADRLRAAGGQMRGRLAAIDTDGDGAWSLAEIQAVRPEFDPDRFSRLDTNGDGLITADERPGRRGFGHR